MCHFVPFLNDITADNCNFLFSKFLQIVRSAIDFYAPLRQASRRQKRIQSKPLLTKGLLVSIKRKQKLYRSHFMSHDLEKQQFYIQYSNKLNKIKYKAKKFFYVDLCEEYVSFTITCVKYGLQLILYFIQNLIIYQLLLNCVLMILS